jgi:putative spermidine/putrescine transport system permease protein
MSTAPVAGPARRPRRRVDLLAWVLGTWVVLFMIFLLLPIVAVVVVSFSSASYIAFPMPGLSLQWYWRILEYQPFVDALIVSIELALSSAACAILLGVPATLWVARSHSRAAAMVGNLLLAPISIPAIVLGFSLLYLLSAMGFGISFTALLISHTVVSIPYIARTVLAVYRALPPDFEEAAAVLGATRWQTLRYTTLPLIRPGIFAGRQ